MKITPRRYRMAWAALIACIVVGVAGAVLMFAHQPIGLALYLTDGAALITLFIITRRWTT